MPKRIVHIFRKRITQALQLEIEFSRIQRNLGKALDESADLVSLRTPVRFFRGAHRRARVILRAHLDPRELSRGLGQVVDETIDQIPLETPRGIARIIRKRTRGALESGITLSDVQRGLRRTVANTWNGVPLDPELLTKQGAERSRKLNRQLAWSLAFVAGAVNAGGYLAVQTYTSHVTGTVSRVADELVLGHKSLALAALGVAICFFFGAFCAGLLISLGKRHRFRAPYAFSLLVEAVLLLVFGFMGASLGQHSQFFVPATVALLSFVMGMHNSVVTNISDAEVRTTHLTGIVTDLGLEFSRLFYFNVDKRQDARMGRILGNRGKLKLHGVILASFFSGGLAGAYGFKHVGYKVTVFLAAFLLLLVWRPVMQDFRIRLRWIRRSVVD